MSPVNNSDSDSDPSSEIIAMSILHCVVRSGDKRSNINELKFDVKFCEIKAEDFQATSLTLLA